MNEFKIFLVGLTALCCVLGSTSGEKIINCYWGTWAYYRPEDGAYKPNNIDPTLCTILSYSFMGINPSGEAKILDTWLDMKSGLNNIEKAMALKEINPKLKVMAVVGGWGEGSQKYSQMAADPAKRKTFIASVLKLIDEYKFDGLDLDWEYPARREGSSPNDKANFLILCKEIYQALKPRSLFGIAVSASGETAEISYQLPEIAKYVDFINVMSYDYAGSYDGVVGHNAPLAGKGANNVQNSMKFWLSKGVPANKLVMGLPLYGHTFKLQNSQQYKPGSPTIGPGASGPYTREAGMLGFNEICKMKHLYKYEWSDEASVPILYNSNEVISYDDAKSIGLKVQLAKQLDLAGVMVWSIETDDFHGRCGTKNQLLKTINNHMGKQQDMSPSGNENLKNENSTVSKPKQPNQPKPTANDSVKCRVDGTFPHESDCRKFVQCSNGVEYEKICPASLLFDVNTNNCNWPNIAACK